MLNGESYYRKAGAVPVSIVILGRFIGGVVCIGALLSVVTTYISESARLEKRGFFVGTNGFMIVIISICMALNAMYGDGSTKAGARAAIAMIFLYSVTYAVFLNATIWVIAAEILPYFLRSQGLGDCLECLRASFDWFNLESGLASLEGLDLSLKASIRVSVGPYRPIK